MKLKISTRNSVGRECNERTWGNEWSKIIVLKSSGLARKRENTPGSEVGDFRNISTSPQHQLFPSCSHCMPANNTTIIVKWSVYIVHSIEPFKHQNALLCIVRLQFKIFCDISRSDGLLRCRWVLSYADRRRISHLNIEPRVNTEVFSASLKSTIVHPLPNPPARAWNRKFDKKEIKAFPRSSPAHILWFYLRPSSPDHTIRNENLCFSNFSFSSARARKNLTRLMTLSLFFLLVGCALSRLR